MLQVAVSIQSLVFVPQPFFNEPSYESMMGSAEGKRQSEDYSRPLLAATIRHAMLDQMNSPPKGFESIVSTHFALKKAEILRQVAGENGWATTNPGEIHAEMIQKLEEALEKQRVVAPPAEEE